MEIEEYIPESGSWKKEYENRKLSKFWNGLKYGTLITIGCAAMLGFGFVVAIVG